MNNHDALVHESLNHIRKLIPMKSLIPARATALNSGILIVGDILDAIQCGNSVPEDSTLKNIWNSMQENIKGDLGRLTNEAIGSELYGKYNKKIWDMAAELFIRNPKNMRDSVKRYICESVIYHLEILFCAEICKRANIKSKKQHQNYVQETTKGYLAGGWPCGWRGNYPRGRALVYWPYDDKGKWMQVDRDMDI